MVRGDCEVTGELIPDRKEGLALFSVKCERWQHS